MLSDFLLLVLIMLLVAVLFYTISRRTKSIESFYGTVNSKAPTSSSLYKEFTTTEFDKAFFMYKDMLSDKDSLLHMYGCGVNLGTSDGNAIKAFIDEATKGRIYIMPIRVLTNSYLSVNAAIIDTITKFYDINGRKQIEGQVYVALAQAPFYMDENNDPITIQFSYDNYLNRSANVMTKQEKETNPQIQYNGYVIFTAYFENGDLIKDMKVREAVIRNFKFYFRHKRDLCYMSCSQNSSMPCGCASQDAPYRSNCLATSQFVTDKNEEMESGSRYTYAILYRVNPLVADISSRNILSKDSRDIEWLEPKVVPIPKGDKQILRAPYEIPPVIVGGEKGVVFYQHCQYFGWKSKLVPPGKIYTMEELKEYGVRADMSAYKIYGNVKVQLYVGDNPVDRRLRYLPGNLVCLTKYDKKNDTKNDKVTSIEIQEQEFYIL